MREHLQSLWGSPALGQNAQRQVPGARGVSPETPAAACAALDGFARDKRSVLPPPCLLQARGEHGLVL